MHVRFRGCDRTLLYRLLESGIAAGGAGAVKQAYMTCLALFSVVTLKTAIENQYFYGLTNLGIGMRGALSTVSGSPREKRERGKGLGGASFVT